MCPSQPEGRETEACHFQPAASHPSVRGTDCSQHDYDFAQPDCSSSLSGGSESSDSPYPSASQVSQLSPVAAGLTACSTDDTVGHGSQVQSTLSCSLRLLQPADMFPFFEDDELGDVDSDARACPDEAVTDATRTCFAGSDVFSEAELFAESFRQYGDETLPHSPAKKTEAMAMIICYVVANNLTWTSAEGLLKLINAIFGMNVLPRSKYLLPKMGKKNECFAKHHYYCTSCNGLLEGDGNEAICPTCQVKTSVTDAKEQGGFFSILDMKEQLKLVTFTKKDSLYRALKEKQKRLTSKVKDITSGVLYKEHEKAGHIKWMDITLTINTDGISVFSSSRSSLWPI